MPSTESSGDNTARSTPSAPESTSASIPRFSRAERMIHRTTAILMTMCILTAAILYNGSLSVPIGHRRLVELIHVYCGFALPIPMFLGILSFAYRADLRRLGRFTPADRRWLRTRTRRDGTITVGKFNAGQKLNASLACGSILVLLGTGVLMYFVGLAPLPWRSGATFVHDWFALALGLLLVGHVIFALKDPEARRGMRTGSVSRSWARTEHAAWLHDLESAAATESAAEVPEK
ncbi:formate dehydrogenase [Trebonia kvetii]|uniref:Formate dehydrogenase n=1 Tax=Trebonia kvetii TaxID=2480626 RepID=A0A6P2C228_9ACTN|nr:cytochrome b/b6 domain-containing protein [Trebonia kvetii]TVZ03533.1 formate dehydrogenase [Trebonia kvetii]